MHKISLLNSIKNLGLSIDDSKLDMLENYMSYILKKNNDINLTSITDEEEFRDKMIYDSVLPLLLTDFTGKKILDVGTGAGFPGVVISIMSQCDVTLLDSTKKKLDVIKEFDGIKVNFVNSRSEDYVKNNREAFDIVIARAVAPLNILLELCAPLVKVNGYFIAMKGADYQKELNECDNAIKRLGLAIVKIDEEILPNDDERANILFTKKSKTQNKYPREYKQIKERPL